MMVVGQWILFALVFVILFFFAWYTARFIVTGLLAIAGILLVAYVLNEMQLLPEPLHGYADQFFRKETVETVKAKLREYIGGPEEKPGAPTESKSSY